VTAVRTSRGTLAGAATAHGAAFLGVPYAAPPVGPDHLRAPRPVGRWEGVRPAVSFGPVAPQAPRALPGLDTAPLLGSGWDGPEFALTLNVWTPDPGGGGLPVMVFLHGGAFVAGSTAVGIYDGDTFARDGVVLVSVVYRLGVEGFLALDGGEANLGLRDQLAALEWVQQEIAAFGGDPANVTVFGQSAGAISLDLLLGSPHSRGLMRRAISQSGGARLTFSPEQARRVAAAVAAQLGVPPTREAFAALSPAQLLAAQAAVVPGSVDLVTEEDSDPTGGIALVLPVRDGEIVPADPLAAIRAGAGAPVDLMLGDTSEEGALYLAGLPGYAEMGIELVQMLVSRLHPDPAVLLELYRSERPQALPGALAAQALTDAAFHVPTERLAEAHLAAPGAGTTYAYEFAWRSGALGGHLGAGHAVELPFVFDTLGAEGLVGETGLLGPEGGDPALASEMHRAWLSFARDGDPGWPQYDLARRAVMRFDTRSRVVDDPRPGARAAWADVE
jgi:para-nitrobenzyl esterase